MAKKIWHTISEKLFPKNKHFLIVYMWVLKIIFYKVEKLHRSCFYSDSFSLRCCYWSSCCYRMHISSAGARSPGSTSEIVSSSEPGQHTMKKPLYQEQDIGKLAVLQTSGDSSVATKFVMCVAAASVAEFATYPLDLTKTRWAALVSDEKYLREKYLQTSDTGRDEEWWSQDQIQGNDSNCSGHCKRRG